MVDAVNFWAETSRSHVGKLGAFHGLEVRDAGENPAPGAKLNFSNIEFSGNDIKRKIFLPKFISTDLAENVGILIGDGSIRKDYTITYCGNIEDDKPFFENYVSRLVKKLFNIQPKVSIYRNEYRLVVRSKALLTFYNKVVGLPIGPKDAIKIPKVCLENKAFIKSCIRGIMDTDFSITFKKKSHKYHYYPVIIADLKSKDLVKQLEILLKDIGFIPHTEYNYRELDKRSGKTNIKNFIYLNGKSNLVRWWKEIISNNPKHRTKYLIWEKYGFCPPRITLEDRLAILKGSVNPIKFYRT